MWHFIKGSQSLTVNLWDPLVTKHHQVILGDSVISWKPVKVKSVHQPCDTKSEGLKQAVYQILNLLRVCHLQYQLLVPFAYASPF